MCKAFKCDICETYFDGDPNVQEVSGFGIIWSPERGLEKSPSKIQDMCSECTKKYSSMMKIFKEEMIKKRKEER